MPPIIIYDCENRCSVCDKHFKTFKRYWVNKNAENNPVEIAALFYRKQGVFPASNKVYKKTQCNSDER